MLLDTFPALGVSPEVAKALLSKGILAPFPIQSMVVPDAMAGRDVLARSKTGSGKTLAFALPLVERVDPSGARPSVLILVPTRGLAVQVTDDFDGIAQVKRLRVASVYGGVGIRDQARAAARAHILVATPGRMEDLAQRRLVSLEQVGVLILDEADRMLDMGFQPQVDRLVRRLPAKRQTMFFSATLDGVVGNLARAYTKDAVRHEIEASRQTVEEVEHRLSPWAPTARLRRSWTSSRSRTGGWPWSSSGRSVEPTGWSRSSGRRASRPSPCTAISPRPPARTPWPGSSPARWTPWSPPTSPPGVSTPGHHPRHQLRPAGRRQGLRPPGRAHRPGRTFGDRVTFVQPDQQGDVSRMAARLKLHEEFQLEGMAIAPPRMVYTSGRKGGMRGSRRRRKF